MIKWWLFLILLSPSILLISANFMNLYETITCANNFSVAEISKLSNYGCFCGKGNTYEDVYSHYPVDHIDACCRQHDFCYGLVDQSKYCQYAEPQLNTFNAKYTYKCLKIEDKKSKSTNLKFKGLYCSKLPKVRLELNQLSNATDTSLACKFDVCSCDIALAKCFRGHAINGNLYKYDRSHCLKKSSFGLLDRLGRVVQESVPERVLKSENEDQTTSPTDSARFTTATPTPKTSNPNPSNKQWMQGIQHIKNVIISIWVAFFLITLTVWLYFKLKPSRRAHAYTQIHESDDD